jgi:ABC-type glycerol-3-phosphate transport system permease component
MNDEPAHTGLMTPFMRQYLEQTQPWVRLMSIVLFVVAGLMIVVGLLVMTIGMAGPSFMANAGEDAGPLAAVGAVAGVLYIAMAALYLFPGLYLHRYASAIARMKAGNAEVHAEEALKHQRSFWRFVGIATIVCIVITIGVIVIAIGAAMALGSRGYQV